MNKIIKFIYVLFIISTIFCSKVFAEVYYFKQCEINEKYSAKYIIDLDKNIVSITLAAVESDESQTRIYNIETVSEDKIITEKKQNETQKNYYLQYFLNSESKSVAWQRFKYEEGFFKLYGKKREVYCLDVKSNWNKSTMDDEDESLVVKSSLPVCEGDNHKKWTNCQSLITMPDGYKYSGEWKDGKSSGNGIEIWPDGKKYTGEFKNDLPDGKGTYEYADGSTYIGELKEGKRNGKGNLDWSIGDAYVGEFKDDKPHGEGKFTFHSGIIFSGQFLKGKIIKGVAVYPNGTKYTGEFKDDKHHGQGTLIYSNGRKYIGSFSEGFEHGEGTCVSKDGSSVACKMNKGYFVK